MPVYALSLQKEADYFGSPKPFGNTYHYSFTGVPTVAELGEVADEVLTREQDVTSAEVTFTKYTWWGPTEGAAVDNVIVDEVELPPTIGGVTLQTQGMYRELCALAIWRLPRAPVTNRRRWLRKFWRSAPGNDANTSATYEGSAPLEATALAALEASAVALTEVTYSGGTALLCTADGTLPTDSGGVRPFFYTRQIGQ